MLLGYMHVAPAHATPSSVSSSDQIKAVVVR